MPNGVPVFKRSQNFMPLAETISQIAQEVAKARKPIDDVEAEMLLVIMAMPRYRDKGRLDEWDYAFGEVCELAPADESEWSITANLFLDVFSVGASCLYGAWDSLRVKNAYDELYIDLKDNHGIYISPNPDVSEY